MAQSTIVGQENSRVKSQTEPQGESAQPGAAGKRGTSKKSRGLTFERRFTSVSGDPLGDMTWEGRTSVITNPDGSVVFKMEGAEIPAGWSQLATDIVVSKYIRNAGEQAGGYFATKKDADTFEAELVWMLANQYGAFNSPVWFNCGLYHEYGIEGSGGNWAWSETANACEETPNAYARPQCSACFIQAVEDDLMAIYDLAKNEARLFKYGSGTGSNFSHIRGKQEKLSGGGTSSGLMSFLEVLDRAAGATKSGGTTRRAA